MESITTKDGTSLEYRKIGDMVEVPFKSLIEHLLGVLHANKVIPDKDGLQEGTIELEDGEDDLPCLRFRWVRSLSDDESKAVRDSLN